MNLSFNEIFDQDEDAEYYAKAAVQYLHDIENLKAGLTKRLKKLNAVKEIQNDLQQATAKAQEQREKLSLELSKKDVEIDQLKAALKFSNRSNELHPSGNSKTAHIDPDEITFRTRSLLDKIKRDQDFYQQTGIFENINERIFLVRSISTFS